MHYYPYPFRSSTDARDAADDHVDRLIVLVVGLLCLAVLAAIVWP